MKRWLLFMIFMGVMQPAFAATKQIGTACKGDASAFDWDSLAQCNGTTFIQAPLRLGRAAAPAYADTKCDSAKEGMIQYVSGTGVQVCDGVVWQTLNNGSGIPSGTVAFFALDVCPSGWVLADGTKGTPDLRGEFIRGLDNGRGIDASRALGSFQSDAIRNITGYAGYGNFINSPAYNNYGAFYFANAGLNASTGTGAWMQFVFFDASRVVPTANENRPRNVALLVCQKT